MKNDNEISQKKRVLVFPCGSEIGLEIHRALCYSRHVALIGASSVETDHGRFVYKHHVTGLPFVDHPDFIGALADLGRSLAVDYVFPAHDSVVLALAEHVGELPFAVLGSPLETCVICRSKHKTYAHLAGAVRVPRVYDPGDPDIPFPVFLKPDVGQGSRGVITAHSRRELEAWLARDPSLLALENLPGREYTVDCFSDRHGALRFAGVRERLRIVNGISAHTRPVADAALEAMAVRIHEALSFRGQWFFQAKQAADGEAVLLEVAPRVSGSSGLFRHMGVNLPLLTVFDRMGLDVSIDLRPVPLEMSRALSQRFMPALPYAHAYMDWDDTICLEDGINPLAVLFILQCRERGVRVHLLSRHAGDLRETLGKHALGGLFDTIQRVAENEEKADHIAHRDAVFIDDSFSERARVREKTGIATFAPDELDALIDWRR